MKTIQVPFSKLTCGMLVLGFEGENNHAQVRIDCASVFEEYPHATPSLIVKPSFSAAYPVVVDRDGTDVVWLITSEILSFTGDGEIQLVFYKDDTICKSAIAKIRVSRSLQVTGDMPDPVAQWIDDANAKLAEVDAQIEDLEDMVEAAEAARDEAQDIADDIADDIRTSVLIQPEQPTEDVNVLWIDSDTVTETEVPTMDEFNGLRSAIEDKLDAPQTPGTDGQVLGLDSNLEPVWVNQSGGGTSDYTQLSNKPQINSTTLSGNKSGADLGLLDAPSTAGTSGQVLTSDGQGGQSWQTPSGGAVQDVQVNGVSVLQDGVANVPIATSASPGTVKIESALGISISNGRLMTSTASSDFIKAGTHNYKPIVPAKQHESTFYGLAKAAGSDEKNSTLPVGQYTESAKSAIHEMLNGSVSVSGTTPTINALSGVRYVCGEVSTITITVPTSGIIDVVFTSGSTPAVLTINGTVRWANGFDPDNLDADTVYELNIADGLGVAGAWT